jgi:YesN/AraC family two-component response regulator
MLQQYKVGSIDKAHNGKDGLTKIQENIQKSRDCLNHQTYKFIIIDKKMPIMDGIALGKNII